MKLIHDIINRRLDQMKDLQLNNQDYKGIWHFYQVYRICLNVSGIVDNNMKTKQILMVKLLYDSDNTFVLNKLKSYMSEDSAIIESVINNLKEKQDNSEVLEDFYPSNIFAVNLDDRNL